MLAQWHALNVDVEFFPQLTRQVSGERARHRLPPMARHCGDCISSVLCQVLVEL